MRKIEQSLIAAIRANKPFKMANTQFIPYCPGNGGRVGQVLLHGNLIATYKPHSEGYKCPKEWHFNLAGWNTTTTRSRINALSRTFLGYTAVANRKGVPYCGAVALSDNEWF